MLGLLYGMDLLFFSYCLPEIASLPAFFCAQMDSETSSRYYRVERALAKRKGKHVSYESTHIKLYK